MKGETKETVLYMAIGVLLAWGINQGLAFALTTDMPVVAVESYSMVPVFYKGDILVLQGMQENDYEVGDVVVFSVPQRDTPVVHRVMKMNPDGSYVTKGDANNGHIDFRDESGNIIYSEQHVEREDVHGRVLVIVPYLGWVKIGMMQYVLPNILFILIAIVFIAFIYYGRRLI
jgi:signal peptidase